MVISNECIAQQPVQSGACIALLRKVLHEREEWVKVHAAEYLLWAGYPEGVREVFLNEAKQFETKPQYRIGIWRVLVQATDNESEKLVWLNKVKEAFLNENGPDRIHAAETLAKLRISMFTEAPEITGRALASGSQALALYTFWSTAFDSAKQREIVKNELVKNLTPLSGSDEAKKSISAYALRQLGDLNEHQWRQLADEALQEVETSTARVNMLGVAWSTAVDPADPKLPLIKAALLKYHLAKTKGERSEMAMALAAKGNGEDLSVLTEMFENKHPLGDAPSDDDVRAAAAYAILKIRQRGR
ncbi:hypothetical protein SAMN05216327_11383 [Dyadobacter sp. SG02]|uniref:hypothetical protein n=1 Tax=Dyadobacter sp. SG02 TaxID=1855291 RepID=UPI0008B0B2B0|nr:hypothetical protein [Dyadobacter sp. SG02]SEJ58568.1 hypothetical protein SAMN05216327_11383 [Dyadobacter sp. SG02]